MTGGQRWQNDDRSDRIRKKSLLRVTVEIKQGNRKGYLVLKKMEKKKKKGSGQTRGQKKVGSTNEAPQTPREEELVRGAKKKATSKWRTNEPDERKNRRIKKRRKRNMSRASVAAGGSEDGDDR
ncbi:hypothetical protein BO71DRAFT_1460 [Aspergillus ellipticus CBS 707.79]|uniref:Uncharacterized protein n=1 Tax=Aspergillus ellipticus CBS 707.79 TaxID=1448320 RepID=A0A319DV33_9EURO|nr:hypothetical protein BO71DRAFT_1460 [Aspergillus ellipticus CBS 707.79]